MPIKQSLNKQRLCMDINVPLVALSTERFRASKLQQRRKHPCGLQRHQSWPLALTGYIKTLGIIFFIKLTKSMISFISIVVCIHQQCQRINRCQVYCSFIKITKIYDKFHICRSMYSLAVPRIVDGSCKWFSWQIIIA